MQDVANGAKKKNKTKKTERKDVNGTAVKRS